MELSIVKKPLQSGFFVIMKGRIIDIKGEKHDI